MLNHARTLLLNQDSRRFPGYDTPGEELVPLNFTSLRLPGYVQQLRAILFGRNPDRAYINYRLQQYLAILHSTPFVDYLLALDPRVTYDHFSSREFLDPAFYLPQAHQVSGDVDTAINFLGNPSPPDGLGRMRYQYEIETLSSSTVRVRQTTQPESEDTSDFTPASGLSPAVALGHSGYSFQLNTDATGEQWQVTIYNRPQKDLPQVVAELERGGAATLVSLFGESPREPYLTLENLWRKHEELPYRLSGLLLAVIGRTEEVRSGG